MTEPDNATLAEKVLGWKRLRPDAEWAWLTPTGRRCQHPPDFSNDIAAAFMLLEALPGKLDVEIERYIDSDMSDAEWSCLIPDYGVLPCDYGHEAIADTPAAAITQAVWAWLEARGTSGG